jgi:hypothetical protein
MPFDRAQEIAYREWYLLPDEEEQPSLTFDPVRLQPVSLETSRLTPEQAAEIETGGAKTKARANIEAIRTIKKIVAEGGRAATLEEQQKIARFVGWGAERDRAGHL